MKNHILKVLTEFYRTYFLKSTWFSKLHDQRVPRDQLFRCFPTFWSLQTKLTQCNICKHQIINYKTDSSVNNAIHLLSFAAISAKVEAFGALIVASILFASERVSRVVTRGMLLIMTSTDYAYINPLGQSKEKMLFQTMPNTIRFFSLVWTKNEKNRQPFQKIIKNFLKHRRISMKR